MRIPWPHTQRLGFSRGGWDQNLPLICALGGSDAASSILACGIQEANETQCQAALMHNAPHQPETALELGAGSKRRGGVLPWPQRPAFGSQLCHWLMTAGK